MSMNGSRSVCMLAYTNYARDARVRREAETLVRQGFAVTCLTPGNDSPDRHQEIDGVQVRQLGMRKYTGKNLLRYSFSYLAFLAAGSLAITGMWLRRGLDAIHVHNMPDFLVLAALLPRLAGKKVILDVHDSMPETFSTKFVSSRRLMFQLLSLEERASALMAHRVICVNHPQRDALVGRGIPLDKTFVSLNSPDDLIFKRRSPSVRPSEGGRFRLVYHGTMAERLGVDLVIRAVALLEEELPELELHLWGRGEDLHHFEALSLELGQNGRVQFKPAGVPLHDLPRELAKMDVGVVGNRQTVATELMLPVKLLEYVALGIPVIAPRLKTIQHYFTEDQVAFFDPGSPESIAQQIVRLRRDPAGRSLQAEGAQSFLDGFGWEIQGPQLVELYSSLCNSQTEMQ